MARIQGADKVEKAVGSFKLGNFRIVRHLCFYETKTAGTSAQCVRLILETEGTTPTYRAQLDFSGVSGLRLANFGGGETRIVGFDIVDITNRQWEKLNWEVIDYEGDNLNFMSDTAQITSVTPAATQSPPPSSPSSGGPDAADGQKPGAEGR